MMLLDLILAVYRKVDKHRILFPWAVKKTFHINGIALVGDRLDPGFMVYPKHYDEAVNKFYQLVAQEHHPSIVLDIGANYGFISCILNKYLKNAVFVAVEPNQRLIPYLEKNLYYNDVYSIIVNAVCTDHTNETVDFFINPSGSQDSRVIGKKGWKKQPVKAVSIDSILYHKLAMDETVFIKTDTQGWEGYVYKGGKEFFANNNKWLMRMEFCPVLLEYHNTDPLLFLSELVSKYDVVDINSPAYTTPSIDYLFQCPLKLDQLDNFISYVNSLKEKNIGWTDILIRPKKL